MQLTSVIQLSVGSDQRWVAAGNRSSEAVYYFVRMRGYLGRRDSISLIRCVGCERPLFHLHDCDFRVVWKRGRLRLVWPLATPRIDCDLLGLTVWHAGNHGSSPMAGSDGDVRCCLYCVWSNFGFLRGSLSPACSVYAARSQSARRFERKQDRPGRV